MLKFYMHEDRLIGVVLPVRTFIKFVGGGDVHSKEVITRLAKKTDILLLPPPSEIIDYNAEICNFLRRSKLTFQIF
ncbi:hypothetical protein [Acidianus manzaensis]|uniref:hypothetical protein n=1 Tax=Acidianus manzaensis TaxID=282676 RepID=UPI001F30D5F8|nr:hypothetical protein [Acidianus manzaensis]